MHRLGINAAFQFNPWSHLVSYPHDRNPKQSVPVDRRPRPLPSRADPLPKDIEQIRDRNQRDGHEPKHTRRPVHAHLTEHDVREERETAGEETAEEGVGRDRARRDLLERVDEVVQRRLEDGEEAEAHEHGADEGPDPVDLRVPRPAEDEEAGGEQDRADHHGGQAGFGDGEVVVGAEALDVEFLVEEVDAGGEEDADEVGEEGQGADDLVPAAHFLEFDGEGGQTEVDDAVDEGGVERDEEADRRGEERERPDEVLVAELFEGHVPFFVARVERPVARVEAEALGFVDQQDWGVAFVEEEDVHGEEEEHHDAGDLEVFVSRDSGRARWVKRGTRLTYSVHRHPR